MDALDILCAQLTRDLFAIAKFFFGVGRPYQVLKQCQQNYVFLVKLVKFSFLFFIFFIFISTISGE